MNISTETVTTTVFTIKLNDADVGEILADPSAFQRQLRELRHGEAKARAKRMGRKVVDYPKAKAADGRSHPARKQPEPKPCPK